MEEISVIFYWLPTVEVSVFTNLRKTVRFILH